MKKSRKISLLPAVVLGFGLLFTGGCTGNADETAHIGVSEEAADVFDLHTAVVGRWGLVEVSNPLFEQMFLDEGISMDQLVAAMGGAEILINQDGTAILSAGGIDESATWQVTGVDTIEVIGAGQQIEFTLQDDKLLATLIDPQAGPAIMTFERR